jgi:hypothetical protein
MVAINPMDTSCNLDLAQTKKVVAPPCQNEQELARKTAASDMAAALTGSQLKERMHKHIDNLFGV